MSKKNLILALSILTILNASFFRVAASGRALTLMEQEYISKIQIINRDIEQDMSLDMRHSTGDVDYEFLTRLQTLQRIILTTAQAEERFGQDAAIKKYANLIIEDKKHYLEKIEKLIPEIQETLTEDKVKEGKYSSSYDHVYKKLTKSARPIREVEEIIREKGVDREFLGRIILQQEAMTEMLTLIHSHSSHEKVIDFVESIAVPHQKQLEELYRLLE